jgi:multicomponent Na+:H+ antiporter subunit D
MDAVVVLAVAVPLLSAAVLAGTGPFLPRAVADVATTAAAVATALACGVTYGRARDGEVVHWFAGWAPVHGFALGIDLDAGLAGAGLATAVAVVTAVGSLLVWRYLDVEGTTVHVLLLVLGGAMVGFCLTGDLFNLFVFFELMSVAAYGLTGHKSDERGPVQGTINFAVTNSVGGFLVLLGIALLYGRLRTLNLAQLGRLLEHTRPDALVVVALTFVATGFLVKAAVVPLHFWLADAHAVAPAAACVLFSGVMVELGLFGVARVYWSTFSAALPPTAGLRAVLVAGGVLTVVVGGVMCLVQQHLKRLLALSTVSHAGLLLVAVGLLGPAGLAAAGVYVLGHAAAKGALFACTGILLHRTGKVDVLHLHGRGRRLPGTAALWFVGALALAGLPPFATYLGKGVLDEAAHHEHLGWIVLVGVASSALTGGAVLRAGAQVFLGWGAVEGDETARRHGGEQTSDTERDHRRTPIPMVVAAVAMLAAGAGLGVLPGVTHQAAAAATQFTDRVGSAAVVLDGATPRPPVVEPSLASSVEPAASMVLTGTLAALAAVAVAALALWHRRVPGAVRRPVVAVGAPPLRLLRAAHSGHVGDYVAWLTVAAAALGGALALVART